jgi:hypothetical protein
MALPSIHKALGSIPSTANKTPPNTKQKENYRGRSLLPGRNLASFSKQDPEGYTQRRNEPGNNASASLETEALVANVCCLRPTVMKSRSNALGSSALCRQVQAALKCE